MDGTEDRGTPSYGRFVQLCLPLPKRFWPPQLPAARGGKSDASTKEASSPPQGLKVDLVVVHEYINMNMLGTPAMR